MANPMSPSHFNGYENDPIFQTTTYTQDISEQMRVPKRIKATGGGNDDEDYMTHNGAMNSWNYHEKFDMTVPERIIVAGYGQHSGPVLQGTRSAPREIILENAILPKDPGTVRVLTPPRMITMNEHHFPTAIDDPPSNEGSEAYGPSSIESNEERHLVERPKNLYNTTMNDTTLMNTSRDATPIGDRRLTPSEEVQHLRRQIVKLNRRMLSIEIENRARNQRDRWVYCLGLTYFVIKTIMWLNRN